MLWKLLAAAPAVSYNPTPQSKACCLRTCAAHHRAPGCRDRVTWDAPAWAWAQVTPSSTLVCQGTHPPHPHTPTPTQVPQPAPLHPRPVRLRGGLQPAGGTCRGGASRCCCRGRAAGSQRQRAGSGQAAFRLPPQPQGSAGPLPRLPAAAPAAAAGGLLHSRGSAAGRAQVLYRHPCRPE